MSQLHEVEANINDSKVHLLSLRSLHTTAYLTLLSHLKMEEKFERQKWKQRDQDDDDDGCRSHRIQKPGYQSLCHPFHIFTKG